jgi:hypothetical protein
VFLSSARALRALPAWATAGALAALILGGVREALPPSTLSGGEAPRVAFGGVADDLPDVLRSPAHPGLARFPDGAPARVTGGFGEDSCLSCHWNGSENAGEGSLRLKGFPERYEAGRRYPLTLELGHAGMRVGGFQMATRTLADTVQAGSLQVPGGEEERVTVVTDREVQFAQHLEAGTLLDVPGSAVWTVVWTAPADSRAVVLHAAAVAGDGDRSQIGDHVYTLEKVSRPRVP